MTEQTKKTVSDLKALIATCCGGPCKGDKTGCPLAYTYAQSIAELTNDAALFSPSHLDRLAAEAVVLLDASKGAKGDGVGTQS